MKSLRIHLRSAVLIVSATLLLSACASYDGWGLAPGVATLPEVLQTMGEPAMRWDDPDGSSQLAYPRGPLGTATFMVHIDPQGKLQKIENVLDMRGFSRVQAGMDKAQVLRALGPAIPEKTVYFEARDELVWEWRYCNDWNRYARFYVLFDGKRERVRSTQMQEELCEGPFCWCGKSR